MKAYHVTTDKKIERYKQTGCILSPVRFWPNLYTANRWAKKTGRNRIVTFEVENSYPLPDHKPARWTLEFIKEYEIIPNPEESVQLF